MFGAARALQVAILLFDDVEVLDFAGPFEVFGVARSAAGEPAFEVVTVALEPGPVFARRRASSRVRRCPSWSRGDNALGRNDGA